MKKLCNCLCKIIKYLDLDYTMGLIVSYLSLTRNKFTNKRPPHLLMSGVPGLGVRWGVAICLPQTQPRLPHHVLTLSDRGRDCITLSLTPDLFVPSLECLQCRLRCQIWRFRVGEKASSMVGVGMNGDRDQNVFTSTQLQTRKQPKMARRTLG